MSDLRKHARNLMANWIGQAAGLVVVFFLSPFVVHSLGKTDYGLWSLLNVFTGYLGVFDLGMRASTGRFLIFYVGRKDLGRVNETLRTGLSFYSLVSLLIVLVAVILAWAFPLLFPSVPAEQAVTVRFLLPLLALNVWMSAMSGAFASILAAHDRFDLSQGVDVAVLGIRTGAIVAVLLSGYGIVGMTLATVGASALSLAGNYVLAHRVHPGLRAWPMGIVRDRLKEMFGYGVPSFLRNIVGMLIGQTDLVVVGVLLGVSAVTTYSIGAMLVWYSGPFIGQIAGTVFPSLQRSAAVGDVPSMRWTYMRLLKMILIVGLPMFLGYMFFGDRFICLWMGPGFPEAFTVMTILSVARLVLLMSAGADSLLSATGNVWPLTIATGVEAVVNLTLSVTFVVVLHWGLAGVAAANLAAVVLGRGLFLPWLAARRISIGARAMAKGVLLPGLLCGALFAGWCFVVRTIVTGQTWTWFAFQVILALVGYSLVAIALLVPRADRARVWKFLGLAAVRSRPKD